MRPVNVGPKVPYAKVTCAIRVLYHDKVFLLSLSTSCICIGFIMGPCKSIEAIVKCCDFVLPWDKTVGAFQKIDETFD